MSVFATRWPAWYLLLAAYCLYLGFNAFRQYRQQSAHLAAAEPGGTTTPRERGQLAGYRARILAPALGWTCAAVALLTGLTWVRPLLALVFLLSARSVFRDFATGFAEGTRAAQLAAAPEYVKGRVRPRATAYAAAAAYAGLTRLLPFGVVVYSMRAL